MKRGALLTVALLGLLSLAPNCGGTNPSPVPPTTLGGASGQGGSPSVGGSGGEAGTPNLTACQRAQWTLEALRCPQAATPEGTPFAVVCERAKVDGRDFHPACIAGVTSCADVEPAYRGELCR
jgi:hypothetical protein